MIGKTKNFFSEVKVELQKASWPWDPNEKGFRRYKELTDSTLVVIIAMSILSLSIFRTPGGTRTPNRRFWRPLLYQLSYWRKVVSL